MPSQVQHEWMWLCVGTATERSRTRIAVDVLRLVSKRLRLGHRFEFLERVVLDLPDALSGEVERRADLLERAGLRPAQAEAQLEHLALISQVEGS